MNVVTRRCCVVCIKRYILMLISLSFLIGIIFGIVIIIQSDLDTTFATLKSQYLHSKTKKPIVQFYPDSALGYKFHNRRERHISKKNVLGLNPILWVGQRKETEMEKKSFRDQLKEMIVGSQRNHPFIPEQIDFNDDMPNYKVHVFYYGWYGTPEKDGDWYHWDHEYIPNWNKEDQRKYPKGRHHPPGDVGSNFYPSLGCYSSLDPVVMDTHMKQIRSAGIGVVVVSWYPPNQTDKEGIPSDDLVPKLLDVAQKYNLKITLHIEPYKNRNPINFRDQLEYIINQYGSHPAFYKMKRGGKEMPCFYIYDSYITPSQTWKELLSSKGNISIRGTKLDAFFIGLLVEFRHRFEIKRASFDGFYTYFASNGFSYGSSWKNWKSLATFAQQNSLMFIPSVGPGYVDTRVRPWNTPNSRHRRNGNYYEMAWKTALAAPSRLVSITSFNEWHEGTQIEPAIPKTYRNFTYLNYDPNGPNFFLNLTAQWVLIFSTQK